MKLRLPLFISKNLSVRLSLVLVIAVGTLLMSSLVVMLHYSRKAVKEEAQQKALQTLEGMVQRVDNILLSVEQTSGNFYFNLLPFLGSPDKMMDFSRKLVESNPYIAGCAIAFKPYFYGADREFFMAYVYRSGDDFESTDAPIIQAETFGNQPYTQQVWYTEPMANGRSVWLNPMKGIEADVEPIVTFCLPIFGFDGKPVGVVGVDVSISMLSQIVLESKPSPNSYCTVLDGDGSYIIHPDTAKYRQTVFSVAEREADPSVKKAGEAMMSGTTGYKPFYMYGTDYYVFYMPFKRAAVTGRSMEKLDWSAGIIYPEDDIFGDYNRLLYYLIIISVIGLLLLLVIFRTVTHRYLLPLRMLTHSAQHIAKGNFSETIPAASRRDEVGYLQNNFRHMQQSLSTQMGELERLKNGLQERGKELRVAYEHAKKADRMKTAFLHNMTIKMVEPSNTIIKDVNDLCGDSQEFDQEGISVLANDIQKNGEDIAELLNNLLKMSDDDSRKEASHD